MRRALAFASMALVLNTDAVHAADPIPAQLVGVWASEGAVLHGPALFEGEAIYLGADGMGAIVGGPPPIGIKLTASYDPQKKTIEFDATEGQHRVHGALVYDEKSNTLDAGPPQHKLYYRKYDTLSDDVRRALGL